MRPGHPRSAWVRQTCDLRRVHGGASRARRSICHPGAKLVRRSSRLSGSIRPWALYVPDWPRLRCVVDGLSGRVRCRDGWRGHWHGAGPERRQGHGHPRCDSATLSVASLCCRQMRRRRRRRLIVAAIDPSHPIVMTVVIVMKMMVTMMDLHDCGLERGQVEAMKGGGQLLRWRNQSRRAVVLDLMITRRTLGQSHHQTAAWCRLWVLNAAVMPL